MKISKLAAILKNHPHPYKYKPKSWDLIHSSQKKNHPETWMIHNMNHKFLTRQHESTL